MLAPRAGSYWLRNSSAASPAPVQALAAPFPAAFLPVPVVLVPALVASASLGLIWSVRCFSGAFSGAHLPLAHSPDGASSFPVAFLPVPAVSAPGNAASGSPHLTCSVYCFSGASQSDCLSPAYSLAGTCHGTSRAAVQIPPSLFPDAGLYDDPTPAVVAAGSLHLPSPSPAPEQTRASQTSYLSRCRAPATAPVSQMHSCL
mmetsp:Transcript_46434/g.140619  ORF Transcript_46434/g.140619 Transcript_46434/m.140619 type:complete len:202 (-) Transcript_46434:3175-3780(-)